ncbi:VaFE repeat-containing surface-anchored protein, partial [Listeria goaensis]|uniref:VaFE repeat-containing surface-anchored protein n=1 Tax=Listeria goaensis TaxID=1649188 RepID=UPI001356325E
VKYQDLTPGQTYDIQGTVMDKSTGKALVVNGKTVVATGSFTAKKATGSAKVEFTFNTKNLAGKDLVVFEELYKNKELIAEHKNINDANQTVKVAKPSVIKQTIHTNMPKTGDQNMVIFVLLGAILVALASLVLVRRNKTKQN